jgi:GNAT superfamily N-acetyltransferase
MSLGFRSANDIDEFSRFYHVFLGDDPIGSVQGSVNDKNILCLVVHVDPEHQKKGFGFEMFEKVFLELNDLRPIKTIAASWSADEEFAYPPDNMSSNLKMFWDCYENSQSDDCVFSTATGKWAKKLGFTNYQKLRASREEVTIEFIC